MTKNRAQSTKHKYPKYMKTLKLINLLLLITILSVFTMCKEDDEKSSEAKILSFSVTINNVENKGAIDETNKTISVSAPYKDSTVLISLTPKITISTGATITPPTSQDFSKNVTYEVKAENGNVQKYTLSFVNTNTDIISFSVYYWEKDNNAIIDTAKKTINIYLPYGADLNPNKYLTFDI